MDYFHHKPLATSSSAAYDRAHDRATRALGLRARIMKQAFDRCERSARILRQMSNSYHRRPHERAVQRMEALEKRERARQLAHEREELRAQQEREQRALQEAFMVHPIVYEVAAMHAIEMPQGFDQCDEGATLQEYRL